MGKHSFDENTHSLQTEVDTGHKTLTQLEREIEDLQNQVRIVVRENTMLDHIRQMLLTKSRDLREGLKPLVDVEEDTIFDILVRLDDATSELEEIRMEDERNEEIINVEIREPIAQIDRLKQKIINAKISSARASRPNTAVTGSNTSGKYSQDISTLEQTIRENQKLTADNELLRNQIAFLQNQIVENKSNSLDIPMLNIPKTASGTRKKVAYTSRRVKSTRKIVRPLTGSSRV